MAEDPVLSKAPESDGPKLKKNGEPKKKPGPKPKAAAPIEGEASEPPAKKARKSKADKADKADKAEAEPAPVEEAKVNGDATGGDFVARAKALDATVAGVAMKLKPKEFSTG